MFTKRDKIIYLQQSISGVKLTNKWMSRLNIILQLLNKRLCKRL